FSWFRWLRSLFRPQVKAIRKWRRRLTVEPLESRLAPATFQWNGLGGNGFWSNGGNWVGGTAPSGSSATLDSLVFPSGVATTGTFNNINNATFNSVTISGNNYTLSGNTLTLGSPTVSGSGALIDGAAAIGNLITLNMSLAAPGGAGSRQFFTVNTSGSLT